MKPKPLVIPAKTTPNKNRNQERQRSTSGSSLPLASSQAQNTGADPPETDAKPKLLLFGLGMKRSDGEDGENRPAKKKPGVRRAGKGDLRRL
jgi:hypothetical protein